jgi:ankyrin repeat protein
MQPRLVEIICTPRPSIKQLKEVLESNKYNLKKKSTFGKREYLYLAIDKKNIAELLLKYGASPDVMSPSGTYLIHIIVKRKDYDLLKIFINYKANINLLNKNNETPLDIAEKLNHKRIVELLIKKGAKRACEFRLNNEVK